MSIKKYFTLLLMLCTLSVLAQENKKDINQLSKEQVLEMTIEELSLYDLEELTKIMDLVGASSLDELYELLLNKDVTSASKSAESVFDSPLSTTVLSHDQLIASGATCFEEALRMVPGVIVREKTNGNFDVHIRGNDNLPAKNMLLYSENSQTLVMINGRPVFNYSHGGTLWESLPVSFGDVDRIEVVRGPASALYGPNAVTGVINIITQNITDDSPLISGNFQGGSLSTYIGDMAFRKKLSEKFGIGISGNYETRKRERDEIYVYNGYTSDGSGKYILDEDLSKTPIDEYLQGDGYYTKDELNRLNLYDSSTGASYTLISEPGVYDKHGIDDLYDDPALSKERYAVNGYTEFTPNDDINISVNGGYQYSNVLTTPMGDMPVAMNYKESKTGYVDLRANIKDFTFQANYNGGDIDYMCGNEGFELDLRQYTVLAEYDLKLNNLNIRPGLNYQSMSYDDTPYITEMGRGYLNGKKTLDIMAGSIRLDYKPTDKLRLIAALRGEKYTYPDDIYASWQFVGSYKLNDNNMFRVVYSRANQSPFLVNLHSNFTWNIMNRTYPRVMQFSGNKDYDLLTNDMIEIGYRVRPSKSILIDIEAFCNKTKNYGALMPSYSSAIFYNPDQVMADLMDDGSINTVQPVVVPDSINIMHKNFDTESTQLGISANIDWVISEKLVANGHFTLQKTMLDSYLPYSRDEAIEYQVSTATENAIMAYASGQTIINSGDIIASDAFPANLEDDYEHKSTPSYFGGFSLTYRPTERLEIIPQGYFYGRQSFENQYGTIDIDSKFLLNTKVTYKATDKLSVFANARNILNNQSAEFAYMDENPTLFLLGLNFRL